MAKPKEGMIRRMATVTLPEQIDTQIREYEAYTGIAFAQIVKMSLIYYVEKHIQKRDDNVSEKNT